jgi:glycosyltransferase involved in cell wall biosynthesis
VSVATNSVLPRPARRPERTPLVGQATILFVGRLQARKRVDHLIRACAQMPEPKPRLIIVGDGPERPLLESLAQRVYPDAQFAGAKHGAQLEPYFMQADLFVLPGTGGLAVQEAMAHGLPVIVARGDGTQDDLVRPANGWQITPDDYDELARTLRMALGDADRLRTMGEESFRIVSEEINLEQMLHGFLVALETAHHDAGASSPRGLKAKRDS